MATSTTKPHILAIPFPAQGHINSLMRLCKILASKGFTITFLNVEAVHGRLQESLTVSTEIVSDSSALDIRMAHLPATGFDLSRGFRVSFQDCVEATNKAAGALRQLIIGLSGEEGLPLSCIISDAITSNWTQEVADEFKIPRFAFYATSLSFNLFWVYVPSLLSKGVLSMQDAIEGFPYNMENPVREVLPGLPPLLLRDVPTYKHVVNDTEFMFAFHIGELQHLYKAEGAFTNTFYELEGPAMDAMAKEFKPVYAVGPLVSDSSRGTSLWEEEEHCLYWLDKQPAASVVYISFGSITLLSATQFEEIVLGLEASQKRFLWVFRPGLLKDVSYNGIEYIKARSKDRGYVVSWAPQLRVLSNPAVGGFLTHCGWNSTVESIVNGVPMICWPYFADQMINCRLIVREWRVGIECKRQGGGLVTRDEVERVVKGVIEGKEGQEMRGRAMKLKEAGKATMMEEGMSYKCLQAFADNIQRRNKGPKR